MTGRITSKKMLKWINEKFEQFEMTSFKAIKITRTHHPSANYEAGANKLIVTVQNKNDLNNYIYFNCFYYLKEYEEYIKNGYELYFRFNNKFTILSDLEIDVRKI
jgi:hypothetical protein